MLNPGIIIVLLSLSGCAAELTRPARDLESGAPQSGEVIYCNGFKNWNDCSRYAAQTCPSGYEILAREENLSTQNRFMRIRCK